MSMKGGHIDAKEVMGRFYHAILPVDLVKF
jgi:hypothetical protein